MIPKNSPLGLQKVKNDSKIKRQNCRKQNEKRSATWIDPKIVFQTFPEPKTSPLGLQKVKNDPKLIQNQMSEMKETKKMKVVPLHE